VRGGPYEEAVQQSDVWHRQYPLHNFSKWLIHRSRPSSELLALLSTVNPASL